LNILDYFNEIDGFQTLLDFQLHENKEISDKANILLEKYYHNS